MKYVKVWLSDTVCVRVEVKDDATMNEIVSKAKGQLIGDMV